MFKKNKWQNGYYKTKVEQNEVYDYIPIKARRYLKNMHYLREFIELITDACVFYNLRRRSLNNYNITINAMSRIDNIKDGSVLQIIQTIGLDEIICSICNLRAFKYTRNGKPIDYGIIRSVYQILINK